MDPWHCLRGLAIGIAVAIALGPIGLLAIRAGEVLEQMTVPVGVLATA